MPCQVVCYPTSFLQAIQTVEASTGALPLTTAPHNCSALRPSLTAQETCWLSAGLSRISESLPLLRAFLEEAEPRRCREPAAPLGSCAPLCRCGRYADVGPAPLAQSLWKARLLRKMRWSNRLTAALENYCVKERLSSEDLNLCRVN